MRWHALTMKRGGGVACYKAAHKGGTPMFGVPLLGLYEGGDFPVQIICTDHGDGTFGISSPTTNGGVTWLWWNAPTYPQGFK